MSDDNAANGISSKKSANGIHTMNCSAFEIYPHNVPGDMLKVRAKKAFAILLDFYTIFAYTPILERANEGDGALPLFYCRILWSTFLNPSMGGR
jgi:hypothetical protein